MHIVAWVKLNKVALQESLISTVAQPVSVNAYAIISITAGFLKSGPKEERTLYVPYFVLETCSWLES